jgi:hypothetical protein
VSRDHVHPNIADAVEGHLALHPGRPKQ